MSPITSAIQQRCENLTRSPLFQRFIIVAILLAGLLVGLSTFRSIFEAHHRVIEAIDRIIILIFTVEILIRMLALLPRPLDFFRDGWNNFDFVIVAVCLLPLGGPYVTVLRLFRLLRVLRLVTAIPRLQILVSALLRSLPSMGYVALLLLLLFYVYAVLGVMLFRDNDPVHFGNLGIALLSLFRLVTLEGWNDMLYIAIYGSDVYDGYSQSLDGYSIIPEARPIVGTLYFLSFVFLGTFIMLNLVIGVIINSMDEAQKEQTDRAIHEFLRSEREGEDPALVRQRHVEGLKKRLADLAEELETLK